MNRSLRKVLFALLGALGFGSLVFGGLIGFLLLRSRPTSGPRIPTYPTHRTALLVVDLQEDFTGTGARRPYPGAERMVACANGLIGETQGKGLPIAFVQNIAPNALLLACAGGLGKPGDPGTELDHRLLRTAGAPTFTKDRADAFSNPALEAWLRSERVDRLVVVGLDAAYCVDSTVRGALNRGFQVALCLQGLDTRSGESLESLGEAWRKAGATVEARPDL